MSLDEIEQTGRAQQRDPITGWTEAIAEESQLSSQNWEVTGESLGI